MKKLIMLSVIACLLCGCGRPQTYGDMKDWSVVDDNNNHVIYAQSENGCYTDGSWTSQRDFNSYVRRLKNR